MKLNETTLINWYLVTFHDVPSPPNQILWGTVQDDSSCRCIPGDWVCTSVILEQTSDQVFVTKNSRYTVIGPGTNVELPVKTLCKLRSGMSPEGLNDNTYVTLDDLEQAGLLDDASRNR
jgi:hypothetical protein